MKIPNNPYRKSPIKKIYKNKNYFDRFGYDPVVIYSLKKLKYESIKCIRGRRNIDNTEIDIGFSGYGIDRQGLMEFATVTANIENGISDYGNFATDTNTDGIADGVLTNATGLESVASNIQSFTATAQYGFIRILSSNSVGDKIYVCAKVKTQVGATVSLNIGNNTTYKTGSNVTADGNFNFTSASYTAGSGDTSLNPFVVDNAVGGWTEIQVKEMMLFNLTTIFGSGNEPSDDAMDEYVQSGYITSETGTIGSAFVRTWYDQGINKSNFVQLTANSQPSLVDVGVINTFTDGRVAVQFDPGEKLSGSLGSLEEMSIALEIEVPLLPSEMAVDYARFFRTTDDNINIYYDRAGGVLAVKFTTTEGSFPRPTIPEAQLSKTSSMVIILTYDKDKLRLYLNSSLVDTGERDNTNPNYTDSWEIGSDVAAATAFKCRSLIVFNRALTQSQISVLSSSL